ncbi:hypothetical protein OUZ56_005458 [Daphnia magna]|uniref:Uncharacterized protein n=1 Tax=Daphnia magna TaxID=35525 RepID=A0ABQ9YSV7_9CRUS|nr:hypothetical protein OUZ56_005458 [Daphnia magna]
MDIGNVILSNNLEEADEKEQREDQEIQSQKVPEVTSPQAVADNEKKVTEHPTADGVMVAPLTSTEVAPTQRPIRNRTPPYCTRRPDSWSLYSFHRSSVC